LTSNRDNGIRIRSLSLCFERINKIFFACGEIPFGRRPLYPDDLANPVYNFF
jgi:hypothetical protein